MATTTQKWGCLFDVDGVIIDSETQYTIFWNGIEEIYPTGIPEYSLKIKGSTLPTILQNYYNDDTTRQDILHRLETFEATMPLNPFPHVIDFLLELKAASIPCVIVTSSTRAKMNRLLKLHPELKQYFTSIVDGEMVTHPKPDPECYLKGAKLIDTPASQCIVFEDSINGILAGKAAGSRLVALATTLPVSHLETMHPDMIIPSFAQLHIPQLVSLLKNK